MKKLDHKQLREFTNARFVLRVADVDDLTIAIIAAVLDNAEEAFDTLADINETAFLLAANQ